MGSDLGGDAPNARLTVGSGIGGGTNLIDSTYLIQNDTGR